MNTCQLVFTDLDSDFYHILWCYFTSREMFNKRQAQRWWAENSDKLMELYNVQRFNHQGVPVPAPPKSEEEVSLNIPSTINSCFYFSD